MTASWLPTWPAAWRDFHEAFKRWVPQEYPAGLWDAAGNVWKDISAIADSMAYTRDLLEWILQSYHPQHDTEELFLSRWEQSLGIMAAPAGVGRAEWIVAQMRRRGTPTDALARACVAAAFGSMDAADVSVCSPAAADIVAAYPATDDMWAKQQYQIHFYSTTETVEPDLGIFNRIADVIKPAWETWYCGRYRTCRYGVGKYSRSCYGS